MQPRALSAPVRSLSGFLFAGSGSLISLLACKFLRLIRIVVFRAVRLAPFQNPRTSELRRALASKGHARERLSRALEIHCKMGGGTLFPDKLRSLSKLGKQGHRWGPACGQKKPVSPTKKHFLTATPSILHPKWRERFAPTNLPSAVTVSYSDYD